jgi:hypothetical protein
VASELAQLTNGNEKHEKDKFVKFKITGKIN